jgi:hypothetical protein
VQGLADTFIQLRLPFDSEGARRTNKEIFETIYFAAVTASVELARRDGPYQTFPGSPASQGKLQFDLWGVTPDSGRWDWGALRKEVVRYGMRNSLLLAPMPTASTAQILGACRLSMCVWFVWEGPGASLQEASKPVKGHTHPDPDSTTSLPTTPHPTPPPLQATTSVSSRTPPTSTCAASRPASSSW